MGPRLGIANVTLPLALCLLIGTDRIGTGFGERGVSCPTGRGFNGRSGSGRG